jgi:hypothetical protein
MLANLKSNVMNFARVTRYNQMIDDYDETLSHVDPRHDNRASLLLKDYVDENSALCAPDLRAMRPEVSSLFGKFMFAEFAAKNNVLDTISNDGSVAAAHPDLIAKLDEYAEEVARFDPNCLKQLGVPGVDEGLYGIKAAFLDSVAGYWESKGENFGIDEDDASRTNKLELDAAERIKALCNAKRAYGVAGRFAKKAQSEPPKTRTEIDTLNDDLLNEETRALPVRIQAGKQRTIEALSSFPAAEVPCR